MLLFQNNKQKILEKEIEQKDTYVATIVHDLKNPLIAHGRIIEKLIKRTNDDVIKETLKQLLTSTRLLLELVFSISETYKYSNGNISLEFEEIDLVQITQQICFELTSFTDERDMIKIKSTGNINIIADKLHIRRVISNLISNALRYKKENTLINIEIIATGKEASFSVTNWGYYIKPELQREIFKKYVRISSKFNSQGTGLGLFLSQQIIKAHKGKMFLYSTPEGKNTFGFNLSISNLYKNSKVNV